MVPRHFTIVRRTRSSLKRGKSGVHMWREIGLAPLGVIKERFALLAEESCEFDVQISHGQTQTHTHTHTSHTHSRTQVPILTIGYQQPPPAAAVVQVC